MLFSKNERKKSSACAVLMIGALAMIGAAGIVHKGKQLVNGACDKLKSLIKKEKGSCEPL